jgi:hypothetical protein
MINLSMLCALSMLRDIRVHRLMPLPYRPKTLSSSFAQSVEPLIFIAGTPNCHRRRDIGPFVQDLKDFGDRPQAAVLDPPAELVASTMARPLPQNWNQLVASIAQMQLFMGALRASGADRDRSGLTSLQFP